MNAPERIETERLLLRRATTADAERIFARYAHDPGVTRFLAWPRHATVADTHAFLQFSDAEWERCGAGPYLIESREHGALLGSTGLALEPPDEASTGYVLARDAWGNGYASEALRAMVTLAARLGLRRVYALCHPDHAASQHVLEKCGLTRDPTYRRQATFPNLAAGKPVDVLCFSRWLVQDG